MKKASLTYLVLIIFLFVSCNSGFTINETDFRDVADFEIPEIDESTGTHVYTADFSVIECTATILLEDKGNIHYLYVSDIEDDNTQLTLSLKLDGLVTGDFSNVKVTADYTSLTSDSDKLVERIQFDGYGEMVFEANTGVTSFDPSSAEIVIDLNTVQKPQLGYITFDFESAHSVYDQTQSTQSHILYISIADKEVIPYVSFVNAETVAQDNNMNISGFNSKGFTATYTNDLSVPANEISQNIQVNLLNVEPEYPLNIRIVESGLQGGVELLQTESTDGKFAFMLSYAAETNKIKTTEHEYVFEITDPNGYYTGLSEPLHITVKAVRTYPKNALADLKGNFSTNENASPWSWRMHYRIREEDNKHKRYGVDVNSSNVFSNTYTW